MQIKLSNGHSLEIERFGHPDRPVIILVPGLDGQLISWPDLLVEYLMHHGFHVIRFDARDSGLSTSIEVKGNVDTAMKVLGKRKIGLKPKLAYSLQDMASDVVRLLDNLAIKQTHLLGFSIGGAVAQIVAATNPARILSLALLSSSTDHPSLPTPALSIYRALLTPSVPSLAERVEHATHIDELIGSTGELTKTLEEIRRYQQALLKRNPSDEGTMRYLSAWLAAPHRRELVASIIAPTVIIHGTEDVLSSPEGSQDLHDNIQSSSLNFLEGVGHDIPEAICEQVAHLVTVNAFLTKSAIKTYTAPTPTSPERDAPRM